MSMRDYAISDYGMALTENQIKLLAKRFIAIDELDDYNLEEADIDECIEIIEKHIFIESYYEFSGEAFIIKEDGSEHYSDFLIQNNAIHYIPLDNAPTLFSGAYKNLEEAKAEIAEKIKYAFPVEIYYICGTYFG